MLSVNWPKCSIVIFKKAVLSQKHPELNMVLISSIAAGLNSLSLRQVSFFLQPKKLLIIHFAWWCDFTLFAL